MTVPAEPSQQGFAILPRSTVPYLSTLVVGTIAGLWAGYLWPDQALVYSQSPAIILPILSFAVAFILWLPLPASRPPLNLQIVLLVSLAVSWIVQLSSFRLHGDAFTYGALLFLPIILLLAFKPPSASDGATVLVVLASALAFVLVATGLLEFAGMLDVKGQPQGIIEFDERNYWLPLNEVLGIDGRWPGPFGHNGYTSLMAAVVIVIAVAFRNPLRWPLIATGVVVLLITSGRASAGAAAAGLILIGMFTQSGRLTRVSQHWRIGVGLVLLLAGAAILYSGRSGLTGRQNIWPAFWDLWLTSPWIGVGGSGISTSGGLTESFGHAHSMYLDLLARNGLMALLAVVLILTISLIMAAKAAFVGFPGPLAILVTYMVTAITEPRNDWLHPSIYVLLVTVAALTAGARIYENSSREISPPPIATAPELQSRNRPVSEEST